MRRARLRKRRIQVDCDDEALTPMLDAMPLATDMDGSWWVPLKMGYIHWLKAHSFSFNRKLQDWYKHHGSLALVEVDMPMKLRAYQQTGISFIESRDGRALIGDDMGLGKTPTALGWLTLHPEIRPVVIICPASLKWNWLAEIQLWMPGTDALIVEGRCPDSFSMNKDIYIVNYDILANARENRGKKKKRMYEIKGTGWASRLLELEPEALIIDEAHYMKNPQSRRTQAAMTMCHDTPNVIMLTGTPMENYPAELYPLFRALQPWMVPNEMNFYWRFSRPKRWGTRWDFTGHDNLDELNDHLRSIMIRRTKPEVLTELPPKQKHIVHMPINNAAKYRAAEKDLLKFLESNYGAKKAAKAAKAQAMVRFEVLKQLAFEGMKPFMLDWIRNFAAGGSKLVTFAWHRDAIETLSRSFPNSSVSLYGDTPSGDRKTLVNKFQTDPECTHFFGNLKAASVGLNLIAASDTCFVELPWTSTLLEQAEDRVNRFGQEADSISSWYLMPVGTIYEDIFELIQNKQNTIDQVVDGIVPGSTGSIMDLLIGKLRSRQ